MSDFHYKNNELFCEGVSVRSLADKVGTPCYIYSRRHLLSQFRAVQKAFAAVRPLICFAMKANDNLAVVKTLVNEGAGCDIVSAGELTKALKAGADPKKIVFASVGKTDEEIHEALRAGILFFNVESLPELENINRVAAAMRCRASVALRINPDVKAPTHDKIVTGTLEKKFGLDLKTARLIMRSSYKFPSVRINGVHMHIGSQITAHPPYVTAVKRVLGFLNELKRENIHVAYFNMGGGFGIPYTEKSIESIEKFAKAIVPLLAKTGLKIIMEPGRFLCGNAGIFVTRVLYIKRNGVKKFIIVDGGMNDLIRPSLYHAYHDIVPVTAIKGRREKADVVGPICESGDFFAKDRRLPYVERGDLLAIKSAGAYGYAMASNYNVRPRAVEVLVKGNEFFVVKRRETYADLMRGENMPEFISDHRGTKKKSAR